MIATGNADEKGSDKRMEAEDSLKRVECLRGRLLAERVASRVAKEDAEQMGNKLMELENQLKLEMKSRNRAEKKLKFLTKKLELLNISNVSDESRHSTASSGTKEPNDKEPKTQIRNPTKYDIEATMEKTEYPFVSNLKNIHYYPSTEETFNPTTIANSENSSELESSANYNVSEKDDRSSNSFIEEKEINGENDGGQDNYIDNSLALVPVNLPIALQKTEPPIVNANVQEILDVLRHAREKLQRSMERRQFIKVGSR